MNNLKICRCKSWWQRGLSGLEIVGSFMVKKVNIELGFALPLILDRQIYIKKQLLKLYYCGAFLP